MEPVNLRQVYVRELIRQAGRNNRIVCLDSDSREPLMLDQFVQVFPGRAFTFGISEQDMVSAAGGMATLGLIPFVHSYGLFIAMRALDQVRNAVAYPNLNVKFILSHHGLDTGSDGITHQLTEDIAIFRSIPNIKLLQPADDIEMVQMVDWAIKTHGPVVIKVGKSSVPTVHPKNYYWLYGVPSLIAPGEDYAIFANGVMIAIALKARDMLGKTLGIRPKVINLSSLTDVSVDTLLKLTEGVTFILTIEDHSIYGGMGSLVAEIMSEYRPTKVARVGLRGTFAECGAPERLFKRYEMDEEAVVQVFKQILT